MTGKKFKPCLIFYGTELTFRQLDDLSDRFAASLAAIGRYRVTYFAGVVDNVVELMEHPDVGTYDLRSIRIPMAASFVKKVNLDYRSRWQKPTGTILRAAFLGRDGG
jgi:hypothetical protein